MFKKIFHTSILSLVVFGASLSVAYAETIRSFDAALTLERDSSFTVTETIAYDFEASERHGMFRTIRTEHPQDASAWYLSRHIDIDVNSVTMDYEDVPFIVTQSGDEVEIKIGDPNRTISGLHVYEITYTVHGGLLYGENTAELYWNVTGNMWTIPIETASLIVTAPSEVLADAAACYVGVAGSTDRCAVSTTSTTSIFTVSNLVPGMEMTAAQALHADAVAHVVVERPALLWPLLLGSMVFISLLIVGAYRIRTRHKVHAPIIAQYEPYAGVRPMYAGRLIDNMLNPSDLTAGIIYLAEQGFLKIKKTDKKIFIFNTTDYEVMLLRDIADVPGAFLPHVLKLLFGEQPSVGQRVSLSAIKKNMPQQRLNQKILAELRRELDEDLRREGYTEHSFATPSWRSVLVAVSGVGIVGVMLAVWIGAIAVGVYVGALLLVSLATLVVWTRRTRKGYEARNHLKGFELFLSMTDKDRFAFHNAPEKNPETFMKYLPYAIAFGVEKEWAQVFDDITIPNPSWYDGGSVGTFHAAAFASDMSGFSSSLATSSGSSPSSGGGSAGGGAGGGGGGSW